MKKITLGLCIGLLAIATVAWAGTIILDLGGSSSSSTVDNATIDSRIDQDHASSAETIAGTETAKSVTPKALIDAIAAYTHDILTSGSITGGAITGTTGTFSGAVTGSSFNVTRGDYQQCFNPYEATSNGNESILFCAPTALTNSYKISMPATKASAIGQSRRCSAITSDNCTEEWYTAPAVDSTLTANHVVCAASNNALENCQGIGWDGNTYTISGTAIISGYVKSNMFVVADNDGNHTLSTATNEYNSVWLELGDSSSQVVQIDENGTTGNVICVFPTTANVKMIRPNKLSEPIHKKDGTDLTAGVAIKSGGAIGEVACLYFSAGGYWQQTGDTTWVTE